MPGGAVKGVDPARGWASLTPVTGRVRPRILEQPLKGQDARFDPARGRNGKRAAPSLRAR
jgi:hypothetical protein